VIAPSRRGRGTIAAAVATLALALGACGDDEPGTSTAASTTQSSTESTTSTKVAIQTAGESFDAQQVYADASPSVVTILSILGDSSDLATAQAGQGSGFVLNDDGEIITNAHVVTDAAENQDAEGGTSGPINEASEVYVEFGDRNQVPAEIIGFDPNADVALIKVDPDGLDLQPIPLGNSDDIEVGQPVAAIGSPFGQEQSLSVGIISATDRSIASLTKFKIDGAIQTDASINPGNSGGPLIGADGKVIGIDQQINTTSGGNEGVGFAVPINLVKRSVDDLQDDGKAEYAYIGVSSQALYPQLAEKLGIDAPTGSLISKVIPDGPADEAGLQGRDSGDENTVEFQGREVFTGGDVITAVDGEKLVAENDLSRLIADDRPGDKVTLSIIRDGEPMDVDVTLGTRPSS
jgi:S1-C subfamily serine protease